MLIRHDMSDYNILKEQKEKDKTYQKFLRAYERNWQSWWTRHLARKAQKKFALDVSDACTPLVDKTGKDAMAVGAALRNEFDLPDVILVSPYKRTLCTLENLMKGWPELNNVPVYEEERIREQEHGELLLYNDRKVFFALHPLQRELYEQEGPYRYCYPQGENVPRVRERANSITGTLIRFAGKNVLIVSHHLNILSMIANFRRLGEKEFLRLDKEEKPINCGVTLFRGHPDRGKDGKLELVFYNRKYYH
jgi:broad specificity phosphatase PhoE